MASTCKECGKNFEADTYYNHGCPGAVQVVQPAKTVAAAVSTASFPIHSRDIAILNQLVRQLNLTEQNTIHDLLQAMDSMITPDDSVAAVLD